MKANCRSPGSAFTTAPMSSMTRLAGRRRREQAGYGGAVHARHLAQPQHRHRHQQPVLPQETAASASPSRTESMADHQVPCPCRITWLGLSCIDTTRPAWRRVTRGRCRVAGQQRRKLRLAQMKRMLGRHGRIDKTGNRLLVRGLRPWHRPK